VGRAHAQEPSECSDSSLARVGSEGERWQVGSTRQLAVQKRGKRQVTNGQRPLMMMVTAANLAKRE
jgi:hypothetical protein